MYKFTHPDPSNLRFSPATSLLVFFGVMVVGYLVASLVVFLTIILPHFGFDVSMAMYAMERLGDGNESTMFYLALQGATMLILFVLIPLLYLQVVENKTIDVFFGRLVSSQKQLILFALALAILLSIYPFALKLKDWSIALVDTGMLGQFASQMLEAERYSKELITKLLDVNGWLEYSILFVVIALVPAIGEEIVFRGVIQNIVLEIRKNPHVAVLSTALLFSAMHFSFTEFGTRFLLGAVLGYTYHYSQNFWIPAFVHFSNNALSILNYKAVESQAISMDIEQTDVVSLPLALGSLVLTVGLIMVFKRLADKTLPPSEIAPA